MFRKVPQGTNWFYTLGSATMFAFLSQAVTGVFLAMYYRPDPSGGAYESIRYVTNDVFLGQFVRGMQLLDAMGVVLLFRELNIGQGDGIEIIVGQRDEAKPETPQFHDLFDHHVGGALARLLSVGTPH